MEKTDAVFVENWEVEEGDKSKLAANFFNNKQSKTRSKMDALSTH